jgi:hypothetical protein
VVDDINCGANVPMHPATMHPIISMMILLVESLISVAELVKCFYVNILATAKKDVTAR